MFVLIIISDLDLTDMCPHLLNCQTKHPVPLRSNHLITRIKSEPITNFIQICLRLLDCRVNKRRVFLAVSGCDGSTVVNRCYF